MAYIAASGLKRLQGYVGIELRPITLLVGPNGSGKSSVTSILPILDQAIADGVIQRSLSHEPLSKRSTLPESAINVSLKKKEFMVALELQSKQYGSLVLQLGYRSVPKETSFLLSKLSIRQKTDSQEELVKIEYGGEKPNIVLNLKQLFSPYRDGTSPDNEFKFINGIALAKDATDDELYRTVLDVEQIEIESIQEVTQREQALKTDFYDAESCPLDPSRKHSPPLSQPFDNHEKCLRLRERFPEKIELLGEPDDNPFDLQGDARIDDAPLASNDDWLEFRRLLADIKSEFDVAIRSAYRSQSHAIKINLERHKQFPMGQTLNVVDLELGTRKLIDSIKKKNNHDRITKFLQSWKDAFELDENSTISALLSKFEKEPDVPLTIQPAFGVAQLEPLILLPALYFAGNHDEPSAQQHQPMIQLEMWNQTRKTFILEEPESNLHPNFQSKLADLFIDCAWKFRTQFLIETHSEYLIRKFQYWVAKGKIKPQDVIIYYFDKQSGDTEVKEITIDRLGNLSQPFGPGFYDEAIQLQFELLKLRESQKN